jgi:hypothetical protein
VQENANLAIMFMVVGFTKMSVGAIENCRNHLVQAIWHVAAKERSYALKAFTQTTRGPSEPGWVIPTVPYRYPCNAKWTHAYSGCWVPWLCDVGIA